MLNDALIPFGNFFLTKKNELMISPNNSVNRYSNEELEEFKDLIIAKKTKSEQQLNILIQQIENINENMGSDTDLMDESSSTSDLTMLQTMANRQRTHINDLEKALLRIRHKTYGICIITGELIDKRRLMAVLTTTKSLAAKNESNTPSPTRPMRKPLTSKNAPKSFSRVIKKSSTSTTPKSHENFDDEDEDFDDDFDGTDVSIDLNLSPDMDLD